MSMYLHPQALCESDQVGEGTRIWAFAHIMRGAVIGRDCNIGGGTFVESGAVIGDRVTIKNQVMLWDGIHIHDDAFIGPGVIFCNDKFPRSPRMPEVAHRYDNPANWRDSTIIKRGATVGAGAVILAGLTIGQFAMVGAGAVVTRDVRPHELVVGNPAKWAGWVCACGRRLSREMTCPVCAKVFRIDDDKPIDASIR
ncbi:MAG: N-acetyltransferase [Planctomycetes bacterium]|nr:N-acetyltransferase [Planctomycetota bacterium]